MPRSLHGRAVLILLMPVLTLQLIVSIAFIQRHYEGVTRQMAEGVAAEIALVAQTGADDRPEAARLARALGLGLLLPAPPAPAADGRPFYDLSGRALVAALHRHLPGFAGIDLSDRRVAAVWVASGDGLARIDFARDRVSASNPHQLLVLMLLFGALMTFISWLFLRNQLRPITRLSRAASEFGKGRTVPFHPSGAVEVRAAGAAFLEMRGRIERQVHSRNLMLSGISHDLRTPLTRLRLGLALIDDPEAGPLRRDIAEMEHMLDAFLDFARGDAGDAFAATDPLALVRQVIADAARAGQDVTLLPPDGPVPEVRLRPLGLRRALGNLIDNALRHGTRAEIGLTFARGALVIAVEDDGPGIPPEARDEAMRPFVRLDSARNQDRGAGVGLGLAIVADMARGHGGSLRLGRSERLGGLRAELVLPR